MGAQVEAATGGQDVIRRCGGLRAVLAAVGIPMHKAQPSALQPSCIDRSPRLQTDLHIEGDAAVTLAGSNGGLHLELSSESQGQQSGGSHGSCVGGGVAVLEGAKQDPAGSAKDQVSFGWQHLPSICTAFAKPLPSVCTPSAQLLDSFCRQATATITLLHCLEHIALITDGLADLHMHIIHCDKLHVYRCCLYHTLLPASAG